MDCIIIAGGLATPEEPMYALTQGQPKALLPMGDRTMLERVVDAVQGSQYVENVVVVGLGSDMGMTFQRPVTHLPDHGSLVGNIVAGVNWVRERQPDTKMVLGASADVPLLTSQMVDTLVEMCRPFDASVYYTYVTRQTMETRFPHSNRTFVKLKGIEIAGGDLGLMNPTVIDNNEELFTALSNARKHAWKIARVVGIGLLLKFLFRRLGPKEIETEAFRVVGAPVKTINLPYAEMAMDADKPHQVEMLRAELERLDNRSAANN
ncbi:MAG: NTP transferase domain-containing protein [Ardenticatenaceae bacterium]|nr:NTP transferase domain-containing protein [Ardenticatenaceae bacterium]MCB8987778.1 NTP transferase domain-containing protein [Ardenticatenaceae bacterium]